MSKVTKNGILSFSKLLSFAVRLFRLISHFLFLLGIKKSFSKDNFGKYHQDLPLLQLFEGIKMGVFLHKNVKPFNDSISYVKTKITRRSGRLLLFFFVEYIPQGIFG